MATMARPIRSGPGTGGGSPPRGGVSGPISPTGPGNLLPKNGGLSGRNLAKLLDDARRKGTLHTLVGREEAAKFGSGQFSTNINELRKMFGRSDIDAIMGGEGKKPKVVGPITPPGRKNLPPTVKPPPAVSPPPVTPPSVPPPVTPGVAAPPPVATGGGGGSVAPGPTSSGPTSALTGLTQAYTASMGPSQMQATPQVGYGLRQGMGLRQPPMSGLVLARRLY